MIIRYTEQLAAIHELLIRYPAFHQKQSYSLWIKLLTLDIAYQADVTRNENNEKKLYLGVSETAFTERYYN